MPRVALSDHDAEKASFGLLQRRYVPAATRVARGSRLRLCARIITPKPCKILRASGEGTAARRDHTAGGFFATPPCNSDRLSSPSSFLRRVELP